MNKRAMVAALKTELQAQTWTGGSNKVFGGGSVIVTTYAELNAVLAYCQSPFAVIMVGEAQCDPQFGEEPELLVVPITVRIGTVTPGETLGENPLMGANRPSSTRSEGAGLYQIEQEVYNAIGKLNDLESITIQNRQIGQAGAIVTEDKKYIAYEDLRFEAVCTVV